MPARSRYRHRRVSAATDPRDRLLLYATAFLRAIATGLVGVLIGLYLAKLELDAARIGFVVTAGLAGAATATLVATFAADRLGRRRFLLAIAALMVGGGAAVVFASSFGVILAAAFLGMVNGMGRDRGAAVVIEQAILPATVPAAGRTRAFAWYNILQDTGHALGGLAAALPALWRSELGEVTALRAALGLYVALLLVTAVLYLRLSPVVEAPRREERVRLSPESRRILWRLSSLFALDSLAGGFLTTALLSFFFYERFGVDAGTIGPLFFAARVANAASHVGAAWLAARIGLVNTMVFTHVPSSLLLMTVPFAPTFPIAAVLFILREGLVEMDVPTRQSYVMAVVRPEERTVASGVTSLVRLAGWAIAPSFAGLFMQGVSLATPLLIGAVMKIAYDVLLYRAFRRTRAPEETPAVPSVG